MSDCFIPEFDCEGNVPLKKATEEEIINTFLGELARRGEMSKYKIGDKATIRQWDDMVREFGFDPDGDLFISPVYFVSEMRPLCGKTFEIRDIIRMQDCRYSLKDTESGETLNWTFVEGMFEKPKEYIFPKEILDCHFRGIPSFFSGAKIPSPIKKVIFNPPATIILWKDGTKTVVKAQDEYDKMTGMAMCMAKKYLGNKGNYYNVFKKWLE